MIYDKDNIENKEFKYSKLFYRTTYIEGNNIYMQSSSDGKLWSGDFHNDINLTIERFNSGIWKVIEKENYIYEIY